MTTNEMRQAMSTTLKRFSEKDRDYHAYQARQNFLREQRTLLLEREEAEQARDQAVQALLREREAKASALAELERLKRLLGEKAPDGG
jgi:hypothetical protein